MIADDDTRLLLFLFPAEEVLLEEWGDAKDVGYKKTEGDNQQCGEHG